MAADTPGLRRPAWPMAGAGYAIALPDGAVLCGATTTPDDDTPEPRLADHAHNLRQLAALTGSRLATGLRDAMMPGRDASRRCSRRVC